MEPETQVETPGTTPETPIIEPSQTPLENEIQREEKRQGRTEAEKAAYSLQKNAERVRELGLDPTEILGIKPKTPEGTPMTVEMYEQMQKEQSSKTALELADEIPDEQERTLAKQYLARIKPSGNAQDDLRFARLAVNSVKSGQILEDVRRGGVTARHASAAGAPALLVPKEPELTAEELQYTKAPFNMSKELIISKRSK